MQQSVDVNSLVRQVKGKRVKSRDSNYFQDHPLRDRSSDMLRKNSAGSKKTNFFEEKLLDIKSSYGSNLVH